MIGVDSRSACFPLQAAPIALVAVLFVQTVLVFLVVKHVVTLSTLAKVEQVI